MTDALIIAGFWAGAALWMGARWVLGRRRARLERAAYRYPLANRYRTPGWTDRP